MLSDDKNPASIVEDLLRVTTMLATEHDTDRLFALIVESACKLTGAQVGRIFILDKTKRYLYQSVSHNFALPREFQSLKPIELFTKGRRNIEDVIAYCAFTGKIVNIPDAYQYSGFNLSGYYEYDKANNFRTCSMMTVPFRNHLDETIGVLQLTNREDDKQKRKPFPEAMDNIVAAFASQAAVTLNTLQLIERNAQLIQLMDETNRELVEENQQLRQSMESHPFTDIIGDSKSMQLVFDLMAKVINSNATVLVTGETGTGKELVAKSIHFNSVRKKHQFVAQNCATLPENLLEGELFGYKKGAFSGAVSDKKGLIEHANGGTLFLDEIGDMPIGLQAKLLRVIQEREVRPLGALNPIQVDIRIIAATHHNLPEKIKLNQFREDLYYRLNVFPIELPPLRSRKEDVPALIAYMLKQFAKQYNKDVSFFSPASMDQIMRYDFPGNIREMRNVIERAILLCEDHSAILPEHLPLEIQQSNEKIENSTLALGEAGYLKGVTGRYEALIISRRLNEFAGNQTKTAESLGLSRRALLNKIDKYEIRNTPTNNPPTNPWLEDSSLIKKPHYSTGN
jgi:sigma-54-dependent transcriptional regulator